MFTLPMEFVTPADNDDYSRYQLTHVALYIQKFKYTSELRVLALRELRKLSALGPSALGWKVLPLICDICGLTF